MKIAYLISTHDDPQHLARLINALQPCAAFFIHVDAKADIRLFDNCKKWSNVHFIEERYSIHWGEISQVHYQKALLRAAIYSEIYFDRLITMSGLDYPVWSNTRIKKYFADSPETEFMCGIDMTKQKRRIQRLYLMYRPFPDLNIRWNSLRAFIRARSRKILYALGKA